MPGAYEQLTELRCVLARARELSLRTVIFDVEPLVAWWNSGQQALDRGTAGILAELAEVPELQVLVFSTNSARRPSAIPQVPGLRVLYLASAGKPLRTAPYRGLPRPGAVVGDQVPTDGLLAYRLGFTFLYWNPPLVGVPLRPRLMHLLGRLALPLFFRRNVKAGPTPLLSAVPDETVPDETVPDVTVRDETVASRAAGAVRAAIPCRRMP